MAIAVRTAIVTEPVAITTVIMMIVVVGAAITIIAAKVVNHREASFF